MEQSLLTTIFETTILSVICFAALVGNMSLFIIVYKDRNLRTITNMYILNLAVADMFVSVVSMPVTMVTIIKQRWVFGDATCAALGFLTILSFIASVMFLGMIAINRYFYVVKWNTYTKTFERRKAFLYGIMVWIASIALASPPLFGWAEYRFIPGKSYCFVNWPSNVYYMYFMIAVCFFGPLSAMAFSYYNILKITRNAKRKIFRSRNATLPPLEVQGSSIADQMQSNYILDITELNCNTEGEEARIDMQRDNPDIQNELDFNRIERPRVTGQNNATGNLGSKSREFQLTPEEVGITNTFLLVVALFVICWAPFVVTMFFDVYYPTPLPRAIDFTSLLLGYLNSMCNPILYGVRNSAFRQGFLNLYSSFIPDRFK